MTENEEFIYESIVAQIRMGFFSDEEIMDNILEEVEDNGFEDEISEEWIENAVETEFEKLRVESRSWESPTQTEKLIAAFDELCVLNIIALHNAGYTTSDGEAEVVEVEIELRENDVQSDGYCFYHQQDLERALDPETPNLMIAFQKINNSNDEVTIGVGKLVAEVLRRHGLEVAWDETVNRKIELRGFAWQKLYNEDDEDLLDYSRVVDIILDRAV